MVFLDDHRTYYVYEFWADEQCLYVGLSMQPGVRWNSHAKQPWFHRVTHFRATVHRGKEAGLKAEELRITALRPLHNVHLADAALASDPVD